MSKQMNIIVRNRFVRDTDHSILFGDEEVIHVGDIDLSNLCVNLGMYKSTSQARQAGRVGAIPKGWSELKLNKKTPAWVWNPTE